jgi:hypothetical protein
VVVPTPSGSPADTAPAIAKGASFTYGSKAKDIAAAIDCQGVRPVKDDPNSIDVGFHPTEDVTCKAAGKLVEVATFKDAALEATAVTIMKGLVESFGGEAYLAQGDGWWAGLDSDNDDVPLKDQKAFAAFAARALGGKVLHVGGE